MEEEVEFNNGFVVALALFYGHRNKEEIRKPSYDLRIYGAADHLFNIEIPKKLDLGLKRKLNKFIKDVFEKRMDLHLTSEEAEDLFDRCKELLKEIDEKVFKLKVVIKYP